MAWILLFIFLSLLKNLPTYQQKVKIYYPRYRQSPFLISPLSWIYIVSYISYFRQKLIKKTLSMLLIISHLLRMTVSFLVKIVLHFKDLFWWKLENKFSESLILSLFKVIFCMTRSHPQCCIKLLIMALI